MPKSTISCPSCRIVLNVPNDLADGQSAKCPTCAHGFRVKRAAPAEEAHPSYWENLRVSKLELPEALPSDPPGAAKEILTPAAATEPQKRVPIRQRVPAKLEASPARPKLPTESHPVRPTRPVSKDRQWFPITVAATVAGVAGLVIGIALTLWLRQTAPTATPANENVTPHVVPIVGPNDPTK